MRAEDGNGNLCDRCGGDVGNAGLNLCAVVSDLDPEDSRHIRNLLFCREQGCAEKVLSKTNLAAYHKQRDDRAKREAASAKAKEKESTG